VAYKKFQDFPRPPKHFFQHSVIAQRCLNIQTKSSYSLYTFSVTIQSNPLGNVHQKLQRNCLLSMWQEYFILFIYMWCSTLLNMCHKLIPGLFRTLNFNFQDLPGLPELSSIRICNAATMIIMSMV